MDKCCRIAQLGPLENPGSLAILTVANLGDVAQLVEHLLCKQKVVGSIPIVSTTNSLAVRLSRVAVPAASRVRRRRSTSALGQAGKPFAAMPPSRSTPSADERSARQAA